MPTYIRVKDLANAATTPATDDFILLSGAANGARKISRADFLTAVAGFYTADPSTYKLATLDAGNKVLVSQLPSSAFSYKGTWAASTNTPTLANGTGTAGDTYYASDSGSVNFGAGSISFLAGDAVVYDGSVWQKVPDVVNLLDGKGTLDEAKTTLEIPDVGSSANEVSLNGQLGTMAFQDSAGVSVGQLEADSLDVDGQTKAESLNVYDANGNASNSLDLTYNGSSGVANIQADSSGGNTQLTFGTSNSGVVATRMTIDSSGNVDVNTGDITQRESSTIYNKLDTDSSGLNLTVNAGQANVTRNLIFKTSVTGGAVTERMRLDGQGRLGIGGSPSELLHLTNATAGAGVDANIRFSPTTSTTRYAEIQAVNTDGNNNIDLRFFTAPAGTPVERLRIDSQGRVGVNQSSPGSLIHVKDDADATNDGGIQIERSTNSDKAFFNMRGGRVGLGSESSVPIRFYVSGNNKWTIDTGGNLVASASGVGIDFVSTNSTSGVTVTGSTLDHYEEGTFTGTFRDATSGGNASSTFPGVYTRIGDVVYFRIGCGNINTSAMTAGNVIYLHGLPFQASASKSGPVNVVQVDTVTTGDYLTVAANAGTSYCDFRKNTSGAGDAQLLVSDLTSGTSDMTVSGWYYA